MITGFSRYRRFAITIMVAALPFLWSTGPGLAGEYERLAEELVKASETQRLSHLAISDFTAHGQAGQDEATKAQQRLSMALFKLSGMNVMDASLLEKLKERGRRWTQVLIKGQVYRTEAGAVLVVKMINFRSGLEMGVMQINVLEETQGSLPKDLRDAPGDIKNAACAKSVEQLRDANRTGVELKARYWAARVREPGFSYYKLDRAPGSEFRDYATLQKFYELFNGYYAQDGPVILTEAERSWLNTLLKTEAEVLRECQAPQNPRLSGADSGKAIAKIIN
ncbi:MAG: hypothetical protein ABIG11_10780 [bacterium]